MWRLVDANASIGVFTQDVAAELMEPPINVLRASLHPRGMAPRILNLAEWRAHLLTRLRRQVEVTADAELAALYVELAAYPCDSGDAVHLEDADVVVPLRLRSADRELALFGVVASIGTPVDITVSELALELFFPADTATADFFRR
jgi:transcription regulator MmyB-like protein